MKKNLKRWEEEDDDEKIPETNERKNIFSFTYICATFRLFFLFYLGNLRWKWINPAKEAEKSINICSKHVHQIIWDRNLVYSRWLFLLFDAFFVAATEQWKWFELWNRLYMFEQIFSFIRNTTAFDDFSSEYGINREIIKWKTQFCLGCF